MATTTNFGWETPDDTDLVKDGAAAMRTLGNSIDTSFVDLKGGTTGQILSKASNTDLDYTWIANDQGDITGVTAGTGITGGGTSGAVTVSFDQANFGGGQLAGGKNRVLNGSMNVWQRSTSLSIAASSGTTYTADRWATYTSANQATTVSRQATGDTTNLPNIQYALRFQRNSGQTGTGAYYLVQSLETVNAIALAGKTITFSFYARRGANYSATSNLFYSDVNSGTGTDQNWLNGYTGNATSASQANTLTTTWQRFTVTGTVATNATELAVLFSYTPTGTAGAADYFEVTGIQLEAGTSIASPYAPNGDTYQAELAACQRYYYRQTAGSAFGVLSNFGIATSTTNAGVVLNMPVTMRVVPTALDYSTVRLTDQYLSSPTISAITIGDTSGNTIIANATSTALTLGRSYRLEANNSTSGYVGLSAEI